jgi:hypothetical protein
LHLAPLLRLACFFPITFISTGLFNLSGTTAMTLVFHLDRRFGCWTLCARRFKAPLRFLYLISVAAWLLDRGPDASAFRCRHLPSRFTDWWGSVLVWLIFGNMLCAEVAAVISSKWEDGIKARQGKARQKLGTGLDWGSKGFGAWCNVSWCNTCFFFAVGGAVIYVFRLAGR